MAKLFTGKASFGFAFNQTGAQPLDDRSVVQSYAELLKADTFGAAIYNGMIVATVDSMGMKAFSQALLELMKYPHKLAGNIPGGMPAYQYIALYGLDRLEPVLPQHRISKPEEESGAAAQEQTVGLINRRRLPLERVARRVRTYSQLHPRSNVRQTRSTVMNAQTVQNKRIEEHE